MGLPLARSLLAGTSSVLLTFGVSNSGKSHTVIGSSTHEGAGLISRLFKHFLASIPEHSEAMLKFAALEVYNDRYVASGLAGVTRAWQRQSFEQLRTLL